MSVFWALEVVLEKLKSMGCVCSQESVTIEGTRYVVRDNIGDGGFSSISLVENPRSRELFAVKKIVCHSTEDQIRAKKEIEYHKRFDHSNILPLIASAIVGQADIVHNVTSTVYLVLPFCRKGSLADELSKREAEKRHFSENEALVLFMNICEGVDHIHRAEGGPFAHRDLKPHNILIQDDLSPVIMDLGSVELARHKITTHSEAQHLQDLAAERCSMSYRPPELFQVDSKCSIDERTDVWSLGCLLYAIAFFKSPYDLVIERGDSVALATQSGADNVKFPPSSPYSKGFHELILSMLAADPSKRPFLHQLMRKVSLLIEASDEKL